VPDLPHQRSHFLTNAEWGCYDGDPPLLDGRRRGQQGGGARHRAAGLRAQSRIVQLNSFTMDEIDELLRKHGG